MRTTLTSIILAIVAFILLGVGLQAGGPTMISGFEEMRIADNVSEYTALEETIQFGPTLIILGFIIMVAITGFLGIKLGKR